MLLNLSPLYIACPLVQKTLPFQRLTEGPYMDNRYERIGKQVQLLAQHHELATHQANRFTIVLAEVRNRLEVRR